MCRALLGGYERLREVTDAARAHDGDAIPVDFVCFTDDPGLTSRTWRGVLVEPRLAGDAYRFAHHLKIVGHSLLEEYDEWLWLDNTVDPLAPAAAVFDAWLADADLACALHSSASRGSPRRRPSSTRDATTSCGSTSS